MRRTNLKHSKEVWNIVQQEADKRYPGKGVTYFITAELSKKLSGVNSDCDGLCDEKKEKIKKPFYIPRHLRDTVECLSKKYDISVSTLVSIITIDPHIVP